MTNNLTDMTFDDNEFNLTHMNIQNTRIYINISNDKAELYEKIVFVKLMVIVIIF